MVEAWSVGQLLQATVVAPVQPQRVTLLIGGSRMEAETNTPLRPGQKLTLRVEQRGETTLLRVVNQQAQSSEVQTRALRAALPRQTPLPPLLANLLLLARAPEQVRHESAPAWAKFARTLVRDLPEPQTLTSRDGLRRAIDNAGTFFESRVARAVGGAAQFPNQDFKGNLLRFVGFLDRESTQPPPTKSRVPDVPARPSASGTRGTPGATAAGGAVNDVQKSPASQPTPVRVGGSVNAATASSTPGQPQPRQFLSASLALLNTPAKVAGELQSQLEGAIARVQLHQLNSLSAEEGAKPSWAVEIPVRRAEQVDVWSLRITEEAPGSAEAPAGRWCISVAFELEPLGPVHARLTLQDQKVSASLWAESSATADLIGRHAVELREMFDAAGLSVGDILCVQGTPPRDQLESSPSRLINLEA